MKIKERCENSELKILCETIRDLYSKDEYEKCKEVIYNAMSEYPDSPEPHNLLGIVLEKLGEHGSAMRHFRAAWALEPSYKPVNHNLQLFGTFYTDGKCAFDLDDVIDDFDEVTEIYYDENGIKHIGKKCEFKYDEHGLGHVVRR